MTLHLALIVTCLLGMAHSSHDADSTNMTETFIVVTNTNQNELLSPGFPRCCEPVKYLLTKGHDNAGLHWKLLFTDLDLPLSSELIIYGVEHQGGRKHRIDSTRYYNGAWIRPVVVYNGYAVLIEFVPFANFYGMQQGSNEHINTRNSTETYVGFKIVYWLDHDQWNKDKPYTFCPPVDDVYEGGELIVGDIEKHIDRQQYRIHCIWQLKPVPQSDLEVYINLEKLSGLDSMIKIREGLTSADPIKLSKSVLNNPERISSKKGFYIELSKSSEGSRFEMSYGVQKPLKRGEDCTFIVDSHLVRGFRCKEEDSTDLCIPNRNVCNLINNCINGFDENRDMCQERTTATATTVNVRIKQLRKRESCLFKRCNDGRCKHTARERCPEEKCHPSTRRCPGTLKCAMIGMESCPGENCTSFEKLCADGSCVLEHEFCRDNSTGCSHMEKRCEDGRCYKKYERCPEDPCESYKPFRCDTLCLYKSQVCDGVTNCPQNDDEVNCPQKEEDLSEDTGPPGWLKFIACCMTLVPIMIICCGCIGKCCHNEYKKRKSRTNNNDNLERNQNNLGCVPVNVSTCNPAAVPLQPTENTVLIQPINPSAPVPPASNGTPPSPPPAYGDIITDPSVFQPSEPPPAYSTIINSEVTVDCDEAGPIFNGAANTNANPVA